MIKNILAVLALVIVAVGGALIIQEGGRNLSQIPASSQLAQVPTTGLVGYWNFDDGSAVGRIGNAKDFSNTSFNTGSDPIGSSAATVCAWINPRSTTSYTPSIVNNGTFSIYIFGTSPSFSLGASSNGGAKYPSVGGITANTWNHICLTRTSTGSATFYINGSTKTTADSGTPMVGYNSVYIGNNAQGNQAFDGLIDEVRIYNTALSASDVAAVYNYKGVVTPSTYTLTVAKNGGTVASTPSGLDCAGTNTCSQTVTAGTQVLLTATAPLEMPVIAWGGACSGTATTCTVTVNSNTSVSVNFSAVAATPPVISAIAASDLISNSRTSSATIKWTTNEAADSQVEYGLTTAYGSNSGLDATMTTSHSVSLSNIATNSVYHYRVKSKNAAGVLATSGDQTFTTPQSLPDTVLIDTTAPTVPAGLAATVVSSTQINLTWTASTDPTVSGVPTSGLVGYKIFRDGVQVGTATDTSYSSTGLAAATTYAYTVSAYDGAGNTSTVSRSVRATTQSAPVTGKFKIGDKVQVTSTIAVRSSPTSVNSSNKIGTQAVGVKGTVASGSTYSNPTSADGLVWWYIDYDNSTVDGWSTESYLSAYTAPVTYSLTITKAGTGTGTVTATCGTTTCPTAIPAGTSVKLTATPSTTAPTTAGSSFSLWSGISGCATASTCTFTINGNTAVTAVFTQNTQTTDNPPTAPTNLAATVISATQINLTWTPSTDDHGVNGYYVYRDGSNIANVTTGLTGTTVAFNNTTLSAGTTYTYTVAAYDTIGQIGAQSASVTKTTTAAPTFTITATTGTNGTVTPAGISTVTSGTSKTYTITPSTGYQIASLIIDGSAVAAASSYTFSNVTANHTISATFSAVVSNTPTATLTASPSSVTSGSASTLTWSSTNATSCTGTGFSTGGATSGSVSTGNLSAGANYSVVCSNASGVSSSPASASVSVVVPGTGYYPPVDRTATWTPGVTVGVKGGIPTRTTIYKTLNPGDSADTIANALTNCPAGQVVYLNAGTYNVSQIRVLKSNGCTLRGAGPGKTILKGSAWAAILNLGQFPWITEWPSAISVASGATEKSTQITLSSAPSGGIVAGEPMYIEQNNITDQIYGFGSGSANSAGRLRDGNNVLSQIVMVKGVSGNTVTFDPPLNFSFNGSGVKAVGYNGKSGINNFGVEDLTVSGSTGGYGVWWQGCSNSWMKNVEVTQWQTFGIEVQYCTNFEMRDSYVHDPAVFDWSKGYSLQFDQSNNSLIENNIFYKYQDGILFQYTSSGNVVAYNTLFRSYPAYNGISIMLASIFGNHSPLPTKNLYEGNYAPSFHSDYYYGPSSKVTLLRNYFPATDPDATQNRLAVNIDSHQWDYNVIGNILGSTGVSSSLYLALPATTITYANTTPVTWVYGDKLTNDFGYGESRIYRLGYPYIGNNSSSGTANPPSQSNLGALDLSVQPGGAHEAILHGNWDAATNGVSYKSGASTNIPNSYYLSGKPAWWPTSLAWPPFDAATHNKALTPKQMLEKLPSGYRLVNGVSAP